MKAASTRLLPVLAAATMMLGGCGKQADIQRQTAELEKAFPGLGSVVPARIDQPATRGEAKAFVSTALTAARTNDYVTAVIMLQKAVQAPGITPDQVMAVQAARKVWVADLVNRAGRGDEGAKAALAAIADAQ